MEFYMAAKKVLEYWLFNSFGPVEKFTKKQDAVAYGKSFARKWGYCRGCRAQRKVNSKYDNGCVKVTTQFGEWIGLTS
jgi:hypothetical protein